MGGVRDGFKTGELTGDMGACLELGRHLRVHLDHHIPLFCHRLVPLFFAIFDPISEFDTNDGRTDVNYPLLWDLWQIRLVGEEVKDSGMVAREVHDVVQGQVLILRDVQSLDSIILQAQFLPIADISEKINGDVLYRRGEVRERLCRDLP